MPTPIQHLVIAEEMLSSSALPAAARGLLASERGAFLFGTIAPDVQSVSGQPREATHFFVMLPSKEDLGPTDTRPAHQVMLAQHPLLARSDRLTPAQAAFIAGYLTHLRLDELWIAYVFGPCFGLEAGWGTFRERLMIHNVLRTWLDRRDGVWLKCDVWSALARVEPREWLPFVSDTHLRAWRDEIARELTPGAPIHTLEVFATRLAVPPADFRRMLDSPEEMQQRVFVHLRPGCVEQFYSDARSESVRLINDYLGGD